MDVENIIAKFGGIRPLARMLSYPPSTVQNWKDRDRIPLKQHPKLLALAQQKGIALSLDELVIPISKEADEAVKGSEVRDMKLSPNKSLNAHQAC